MDPCKGFFVGHNNLGNHDEVFPRRSLIFDLPRTRQGVIDGMAYQVFRRKLQQQRTLLHCKGQT